mmetsp:Transcript_81888/g.254159  ORF Transcript_81888/g.254159 Transcript_81888/m.254159 type:complete len:360 (+) Transcript_81888:240-1319(+)
MLGEARETPTCTESLVPLPWSFWALSAADLKLHLSSLRADFPAGDMAPRGLDLFRRDVKVIGLMLMDDHWRGDAHGWMRWLLLLEGFLAGPWLRSLVTAYWARGQSLSRLPPALSASAGVTWHYRKLGLLVAHVEQALSGPGPARGLAAIEGFARQASEQWLKVAGGRKGEVLDDLASRCSPGRPRPELGGPTVLLEFGTFVGYTLIRLAAHGSAVSLEHDPVHARVAQHFLDMVAPPGTAEVLCGRVGDLLPRLAEQRGSGAAALTFLDESGSTFCADTARTSALGLLAPNAHMAADNCLRPGAPLFLAHLHAAAAQDGATAAVQNWALPEFLEEAAGVEDWMAVALPAGRPAAPTTA